MQMSWSARLYLWACQRLYYELAWSYDWVSWLVSLGRWGRWRSAACHYLYDGDGHLSKDVLEIGFGTGELLAQLAQAAADSGGAAVGLELSPAMHREASAKFRRRHLQALRVRAPAQQMPFDDGSFDAVVSTFPAQYIFDPQTLRECARVLRSAPLDAEGQMGGQLLIVGMWVSLHFGWLQRLGLPFYGQPGPMWMAQVEQRLEQAGFDVTFDEVQDGAVTVSVVRGRTRS